MFRRRIRRNDAVLHAQKYRHFVGFSTLPFFAPGEHLIGGRGVNAVLSSKLLNRLSLMFQPCLGLCGSTNSGHSSKPFKVV